MSWSCTNKNMDMITISSYDIKIELISCTYFRANIFNITNTIIIQKQLFPIFYTKYHMISNLIGTMTCLFYLDQLYTEYTAFLKSVS
jgi:hypothetical protein